MTEELVRASPGGLSPTSGTLLSILTPSTDFLVLGITGSAGRSHCGART